MHGLLCDLRYDTYRIVIQPNGIRILHVQERNNWTRLYDYTINYWADKGQQYIKGSGGWEEISRHPLDISKFKIAYKNIETNNYGPEQN
jgi:hypothetical protein